LEESKVALPAISRRLPKIWGADSVSDDHRGKAADEQVGTVSARRRSKSARGSGSSKGSALAAVLRIEEEKLSRAVCAVLALTLMAAMLLFWQQRTAYPQVWLGANSAEIRYGFGEPDSTQARVAGDVWEYVRPGYKETVQLVNDRALIVGCRSADGQCPQILDLSGGSLEDFVYFKFGLPDEEVVDGGQKTMTFNGVDLKLTLNKFRVMEIELRKRNADFESLCYRFIIFIIA